MAITIKVYGRHHGIATSEGPFAALTQGQSAVVDSWVDDSSASQRQGIA